MGVILSWLLTNSLPQFYFLSNGKFLAICEKARERLIMDQDASGGGIFST
ncbi:hypothetical protein QTO30_12290 [Yoonia sp. GPGPB17]